MVVVDWYKWVCRVLYARAGAVAGYIVTAICARRIYMSKKPAPETRTEK